MKKEQMNMDIRCTDGERMAGRRISTLRIVSSGYSDRYVEATTYLQVSIGMTTMRIDSENDRVPALVRLAGYTMNNVPDDVFQACVRMAHNAPLTSYITYTTDADHAVHTIKTDYLHIEAGIHAATGYVDLNDYGKSRFEQIADSVTAPEWEAIRCGLERINEDHKKNGRPVVEFSIPAQEA